LVGERQAAHLLETGPAPGDQAEGPPSGLARELARSFVCGRDGTSLLRHHVVMRRIADQGRPVGWLPTGEPFFVPIGEMRYDRDRVQCHLCGRWFKLVGGWHLIAAHEMTIAEYRELFHLFGNITTAAPDTSERKRQTMLEQIRSGQRDQSVLGGSSPATVARWRSVATFHPGLMAE
jgi:hypothetical protein